MSIQVTGAKIAFAMGAPVPELELTVVDTERRDKARFNLRDLLRETGTFRILDDAINLPPSDQYLGSLVFAQDGDLGSSFRVRVDPEGKDSIKGENGPIHYEKFYWDTNITPFMNEPWTSVQVRFPNSGNIQRGLFKVSLVQEAIKKAGLPFEIVRWGGHLVVRWTGDPCQIRWTETYRNAHNGLTWGVKFFYRAFEGARIQDKWGGAYWPDEKTAKAVAKAFEEDATTDMCANIQTLKAKFPDHPVVPKVQQWWDNR